jgi:hypothetical protein
MSARNTAGGRGRRSWNMHAISAFNQNAQGGVEILALIDAVEGVGEQHDLMAICGAEDSASA